MLRESYFCRQPSETEVTLNRTETDRPPARSKLTQGTPLLHYEIQPVSDAKRHSKNHKSNSCVGNNVQILDLKLVVHIVTIVV